VSEAATPRRGGLSLFRVAGIEIRIDWSWLAIFALVLWSLSAGYFPRDHPGWSAAACWGAGAVATTLFFLSVVVHELSHSLVALRAGLPVPSITLFLFGGAAEMVREPDDPKLELRIAAAGPLASFALAAGFGALGAALGSGAPEVVTAVLRYLAWINVALGVFNLLPGLPLDGGRILRAVVWWRTGSVEQASRIASRAGRGLGLGLALLGGLQIFAGALVGGIWLILIGLFVRGLAVASLESLVLRRALGDVRVADVMARDPVTVGPGLAVRALIDDYILGHGFRGFPVVEDGKVLGLVSLEGVRDLAPERRDAARVGDLLEPVSAERTIGPDAPLFEALERMARGQTHRLLVLDARGELVGLLTRTGLARFLEIRRSLAP
jgi:Zn-dependent protease